MAVKGDNYSSLLFEKLKKSWDFRKEISAFSGFFHDPVWIMVSLSDNNGEIEVREDLTKQIKAFPGKKQISVKDINLITKNALATVKTKQVETVKYGVDCHGLCYPLIAFRKPFGFILLCGLKKHIPLNLRNLFRAFTDTIVRETCKEIELEELNETIRPRAVALSTVHTVHRLMSSTLNMSELLPRIARLSLQVLGANRCSIKLVDKKRKSLLPKTTVDLRKKQAKLKKVEIGKYAPGRAVKQSRTIRGKNYLATPLVEEEVLGVITLYDKFDGSEFTRYDEEIMKTLAEQAVTAIKNAQLYEEQASITMSSIQCIAMLLETRPHGSHKTEKACLKLTSLIGRCFNMNESEIKILQYAVMLHDTGQMGIPEKLLMKKGELTGEEYDIVKTHPRKGASILSKFKPLKPIVPIILHHHESFDGSGYPKGLCGDEIPRAAMILGVVSSFEAMITDKPYRKPLSVAAAVKEIKRNEGSQFDPLVVKAFCDAVSRKSILKLIEKELHQ